MESTILEVQFKEKLLKLKTREGRLIVESETETWRSPEELEALCITVGEELDAHKDDDTADNDYLKRLVALIFFILLDVGKIKLPQANKYIISI